MRYIRVLWKHSHPDEPIELLSELDEARYETRKIEIFRDGKKGFASGTECTDNTGLGVVPVPSLEEIAGDSEFEPEEISRDYFEKMWSKRKEHP